MKFSKRMENFGEGIFSKLAAMKREKISTGTEVIDLSVGAPNIPPPAHVMQVLAEEALKPENYVYALTDTRELLNEASDWYRRRYGVEIDPASEVCSLYGSQEGLSHIALTLIDDGDLTLVPDPCYPIFADGAKLAGSKIYFMPQLREHDYIIQLDKIPADVAARAKFMIVSYPNNPTTAIAPADFYERLIYFAKKNDIIVLHDNAYSELIFDGSRGFSFLSFDGAKDVGVEFNSLSKTYGFAGARVGFCLGNREVVKHLKLLKSNIDYGIFLPIQKAAIAALRSPKEIIDKTRAAYIERRDVLIDGLSAAGWQIDKPKATMFVWAPVPKNFGTSEEFVKTLLEKSNVMVTPGSAFGPSGEGFVRMALVQTVDDMKKVAEQVKRTISNSSVVNVKKLKI
ncbi:MAG: aminotransferase class I/II-fold pyridoxal phosphate-dependent enzyme [Selenomonadaceae bacterium]|nr:aminotransferase class I/II-fold pyridoxal phosphate-dependent enzyme [Selenomonadaceae bacterium]